LQRFLMVALPDGRKAYFRYYDPRILRTYLPNCHPAELRAFFGPVQSFAVPDAEEQKTQVFDLAAPPVSAPPAQPPTHPSGLWPIRPEQIQAFSDLSVEHFAKRVAVHLQEFFPDTCELYEKEQLHTFILNGCQKATSYGFTTEREVCGFVDILFGLGKNFEQDPQYEWATCVIKDYSRSAADRIDQLGQIIERLAGGD
jgi:hypothetical protein